MRIVVTGCGRSGTQYTALVLQRLGLKATHEKVFKPDLDPLQPPSPKEINDRFEEAGSDIEVSWMAAPFLKQLPDDVEVWFQLRDPLKIVRCWKSHYIISVPNDCGRLIRRALPECNHGSEFERSIQYVLGWNRLIESSGRVKYKYRIEDSIAGDWAGLLGTNGQNFEEVLRGVTNDVGKCVDPHPELTWQEVRMQPGGVELANLAACQGY